MINAIALVFIENAFFSWLFEVSSTAAVSVAVLWVLMRSSSKYGNYEARFTRLESDQKEIKIELHTMKDDINRRLGKVEGQLEIVIDLLKNKR
jgi:hypothetical protein